MALVHILDKQSDTIIGTLNTEKGEVTEPIRTSSLDNQNTFDMTAFKKFDLLTKRNRLLVPDRDGFYHEYIIFYANQYKRSEKIVKADASFVDLAKAKVIEPQTLQGATSRTATDFALLGTEFQAGDIEFTFIRTITIEKHTDPYSLLKLIASTFELEIRFRIEINGNKVTRYVDMKKQIAGFEGKETRFGKDLIGIEREEDASKIVTALLGVGPKREDGTQLTVFVEDKDALQRWGRKEVDTNGNIISLQHLIEPYEPESSDQEMTLERLTALTQAELKKRIDAIVSYKCTAASLEHIFGHSHEKIRLGQTLRIKDDGYSPPLYLEARIQKVTENMALQQVTDFEIGNFIEFRKEDLEKQIANLKKVINDKISRMITCEIESANGNVFKNDDYAESLLTGKVFIAGQETDLDGSRFTYRWIWIDKNGNEIANWIGEKSYNIEASEVDEKLVIVLEIESDGKFIVRNRLTITKIYDGQSLYTWVKYANDINGAGISDDPTGKGYIGFAYNKQSPIESTIPTDYTWNAVEGSQGVPGTSYYTWLKYADTPTTGMSDSPTNKKYMGLAHNKTTPTESTNYVDYQWSLVKGDKGDQGIQGAKGDQGVPGIQGPPGTDGNTTYTWVKYADDSVGNGMSDLPDNKKYIGLAYNKLTPVESTNKEDYSWSLFMGPQGVEGPKGKDGQQYYTWIKYADTPTTGMSDDPSGKKYMGIAYNKTTSVESTNFGDYSWSLIKGDKGDTGAQGPQGVQGPKGADGVQYYTWLKYADTPTTGMSDDPTNKAYIGLAYNKTTPTESSNFGDYTWSLIKGAKGDTGVQGPKGTDGQTTYTWIKYGTSASGANMSDDPTGKTYIGLAYNKTTPTESTIASDYTWSLIQGAQGPKGDTGSQGPQGPAGKDGIAHMGPTAPSNPATNATWFKTDTSSKIIGIYKWSGSAWIETKMLADVFSVAKLSALAADLGNIIAGTLNLAGGKFIVDDTGVSLKQGAIRIERPDGFVTVDNGVIKRGFTVQPAYPAFRTVGIVEEGMWLTTLSNSRYNNIQMYTFKHESRYLVARVGLKTASTNYAHIYFDLDTSDGNDGSSATMIGDAVMTGGYNYWITEITMDLGVPTGDLRVVYVRLTTSNTSMKAYGRILNIRLEG
ncbi:phage tail spike protein [Neobacillus sp. WH10]|uniref:phage tail spike protein n=1 Tax=Neobacillus sp. WH10 TaxID=3047873 RepID=UPI0024C19791|nr:phage tail spike protein [Neobacillus sp. WH10]WHY75701.1 phage tail spike protein [Neobacillus sp. WH10]